MKFSQSPFSSIQHRCSNASARVDDGYRRIPAGPDGFLRTRLPSQCKIGAVRPDENRTSREHSIVAILGHVTETAGSSPEDELTPAPPGLFRYHGGANTVLCAGVATGLLFAGLNWLPAWGGFLVGAVPTLLLSALSHTLCGKHPPALKC